ncbi:MAG TPA: glycosyltransferase [Gemmatimonadaceae bacterium]|nr:glycosyltransferase [Gemmatimonadaceae bacterium]
MTTPLASVVIPTHQRRESLLRALVSLATQSMPPEQYEVVVVVDGSDDGSREAAESLATSYSKRVLWQANRGRAAACNAGVAAARGDIVILLDDDMTATPELVAAHLRAHPTGASLAVVGAAPIRLAPELPAHVRYIGGKFNRHLEHLATAGRPVALRDFYSGNLSIRRDVLEAVGAFDERFTVYGNEDLELSIRLTGAGVRLVYEPAALAWQAYDKSFAGLARDNVAKGRTAVLLARLHPAAREQLKLGTFARDSLARRAVVNSLLAVTRIAPRMRQAIVALTGRLGDQRWPGVQRLYPFVLDYLYWCGVREAELESPLRPSQRA